MSSVSTSADDEKPYQVVRVSDIEKSSGHFNQLIAVANHSSQFLLYQDNLETKLEVDPESQSTARKTFEMAHLKMRDLLDETARWGLQESRAEQQATSIMASSKKYYDSRTANAKLLNRPSIFLRPQLRLFNVGWIAWIGADAPESNCLHAIGETPAIAMQRFDEAFYDIQKAQDNLPSLVPDPKPKKKKP